MAITLQEIRDFMERMGIPGRDLWDLPTSTQTFPDGAHWRVEISGVERASTLEALIDEAGKRNLPVHRAIATVGGSTFLDRNIDAGIRGFLVYDEGVLSIVKRMRDEGLVPSETVFKCSVFAGHCSPAGARLVQSLGANTFNPSSDVSLPILAAIRKAVSIPIDVYVAVVDSMGGEFRVMETPEIARVASPCYFKIEPGKSEPDIYKPWVTEDWHARFVREKVKMADIIREVIGRHAPELRLSAQGPADLSLPNPQPQS